MSLERILFLEHAEKAGLIKLFLSNEFGCEVDVAENYAQAVDLKEKNPYDLFIVEPYVGDYDAVANSIYNPVVDMMKDFKKENVPVIVTSVMPPKKLEEIYVKEGFNNTLYDGFLDALQGMDDLYAAIREVTK